MIKNKGFTLVETLVAISIVVIVIISATDIVRTGILSYTFAKDQVVAFHLAQEAFEQIRNIRDENALEGAGWLNGLAESSSDPCYFGEACIVDPINTNAPTRCSSPGNCPLIKQDETTGFYGYDVGWTDTRFRREITLTSIDINEVAVTVTIDWTQGPFSRQFSARENLLDWQ